MDEKLITCNVLMVVSVVGGGNLLLLHCFVVAVFNHGAERLQVFLHNEDVGWRLCLVRRRSGLLQPFSRNRKSCTFDLNFQHGLK